MNHRFKKTKDSHSHITAVTKALRKDKKRNSEILILNWKHSCNMTIAFFLLKGKKNFKENIKNDVKMGPFL